jgi:hypothetical protein
MWLRLAPSDPTKLAHAASGDGDALGREKRPFQHFMAAVPPEPAASGDHPVARDVRPRAPAHDIAHGTRRAGTSGHGCDVAVGGDASWRDPAHHRKHARGERRTTSLGAFRVSHNLRHINVSGSI